MIRERMGVGPELVEKDRGSHPVALLESNRQGAPFPIIFRVDRATVINAPLIREQEIGEFRQQGKGTLVITRSGHLVEEG